MSSFWSPKPVHPKNEVEAALASSLSTLQTFLRAEQQRIDWLVKRLRQVETGEITTTDLAGALILSPDSTTRNLIQPTGQLYPGLVIRAHATQSANPFAYQNSGGTDIVYLDSAGDLYQVRNNSSFVTHQISNSGTGSARLYLLSSAGDCVIHLTAGPYLWTMGLDITNGHYVISRASPLGNNNALTIDASRNVSIPGGSLSISSGDLYLGGSPDKLYEEGSFTATLTGCTTSPTVTAYYVRVGKQVTVSIPNVFGTSNSTGLTVTGMPAGIRPTRMISGLFCEVLDQGLPFSGVCDVNTSGVIDVYMLTNSGGAGTTNYSGSIFTNSGAKGINFASLHYSLQ